MAELDQTYLAQLTEALDAHRLTICVGPQLAEAAGLPTPQTLAKSLLQQLRETEPDYPIEEIEELQDARSYATALQELLDALGHARFRRVVVQAHRGHDKAPIPSLARRIARLGSHATSVYTTTLDRTMARAFGGAWTEAHRVTDDTAAQRVILSLFGRIRDVDSWVLTDSDHDRAREHHAALRSTLRASFRSTLWLFVGFDRHAESLDRILDMVADAHTGQQAPGHFIATVRGAWKNHEKKRLRRRGLELIELANAERWMDAWQPNQAAAAESSESASVLSFDAELRRYRAKIKAQHERIRLVGFQTKARLSLQLDQLYVPLDVVIDRGERGSEVLASAALATSATESGCFRQESLSLVRAFTRARQLGRRGIALLGDPGAGKTTHLKQVLLKVVADGSESLGLPTELIPVFIPLQALDAGVVGLPGLIERQVMGPSLVMSRRFGERLCQRGHLLLLLDGLDEVADAEERRRVARWIEAALVDLPNSYVLLTSRYAGYTKDVELDEAFLELHIRPLDDRQMREFVRAWYRIVERELGAEREAAARRAEDRASDLLEMLSQPAFAAVARVYEMTRNPLLLTAICLTHHDLGRLPDARAKLYEQCISVLLERWRHRGGVLGSDRALQVLRPLAAWMHQQSGRRVATTAELLDPLSSALASLKGVRLDAGRLLQSIRDESGLLTGWGLDEYGFMHLGFQEFLTARHLRNEGLREPAVFDALASHFEDSWWREVILLMLAQSDPPVFGPFMRAILGRSEFVEWWDSEMMQLCIEESATIQPDPFLELIAVESDPDDDNLSRRQLVAAKVLARAMPALVESQRIWDAWSRHSNHELAEWSSAQARAQAWAECAVVASARGGVELVRIPPGRFTIGSPEDEPGRRGHEGPMREVEVDEFYLARTPVTNAQFGLYLEATPSAPKPEFWADSRFNHPEQPVVGVSWEDVQRFCRWAKLRLPTEAQWEYACRAGTTTRFWSGDRREALDEVGWYIENSSERLHPVGQKTANPFGLFDMHGNVLEWCEDTYRPGLDDDLRIVRGGSWFASEAAARSAFRDFAAMTERYYVLGFRPAWWPEE